MSLDNTSHTPATPEQAEPATIENRTYGSLEDAMQALGQAEETVSEDEGDTTEANQPDETDPDIESEEDSDELQEEEAAQEIDEEVEDGDDKPEDIEPLSYEPERVVTLEDGTEATLEELVNGNLRQADYTRKTEALAEERRALDQIKTESAVKGEEINRTYEGLISFLEGILPPEPSIELLGQDQAEYLRQQAIRKSFTEELSTVLQHQASAQEQMRNMQMQESQQRRGDEEKKLIESMPLLQDPMKLDQFKENAGKTAIDLGFSAEEFAEVVDHRVLRLVHLAGIGKRSLENGENARRRIKQKTATPTGKKPVRSSQPAATSNSKKAMRRLSKTGSIQDAMNIDF